MAEMTLPEIADMKVDITAPDNSRHTPGELLRGAILKLRMELEPRPHAGPYDRRTDVRKKD